MDSAHHTVKRRYTRSLRFCIFVHKTTELFTIERQVATVIDNIHGMLTTTELVHTWHVIHPYLVNNTNFTW